MAVAQVEPEEDDDLSLEVTDGFLVVACDFPGYPDLRRGHVLARQRTTRMALLGWLSNFLELEQRHLR